MFQELAREASRRGCKPPIRAKAGEGHQLTKLMTNIYRKGEKLDLPDVEETVPNLPIIHFVIDHNLLDTEEAMVEDKPSVRVVD
jgi:hypothetical protein